MSNNLTIRGKLLSFALLERGACTVRNAIVTKLGAPLLVLGLFLANPSVPAFAQHDYPDRPVTWVVPFSPGGLTDTYARVTAKSLSRELGQPVVVENKPGAGGIVGVDYLANSKPDGYMFLYASSGTMATLPSMRKTMSYDPLRSFTPLYGMVSSPLVMVVAADKPYKTLAEFVAHAKKNPGKLNFSSIGSGAAQHLTGELFAMTADINVVHIPYKATPPALADLITGTIDYMWEFAVVLQPMIEAGKLRPLAVSGPTRLPSLPNVPTVAELGYPNAVFISWAAVVMPKGVPQPIADKFTAAFARTMKDPDLIKYYEGQGAQILPPMPGEKLTEFFKAEQEKIKLIVERAKIPVE
jgi:tripartite-type tricarboxylate transporter receptor subunit TctC